MRGRSVDWQPLPARRGPCLTGAGRIVARGDTAVVRREIEAVGSHRDPIFRECLDVTGETRTVIEPQAPDPGCGNGSVVRLPRLAGRFSAFQLGGCDHFEEGCLEFIEIHDLGAAQPAAGRGVLSGDEPGCPGGVRRLALDALGQAAWTSLYDTEGWHHLVGISCPTASLCAAVSGTTAYTSTAPAAGAASWAAATIATNRAPLTGIACTTDGFCLATTTGGVLVSRDPAGGPSAWSYVPIEAGRSFIAPSCTDTSLCAVTEGASPGPQRVLVSTDPLAPGSWTASSPTWHHSGRGQTSCPTTSLCVAVGGNDTIHVSTNPGDPGATWTSTAVSVIELHAVSCPTATRCVALGTSSTPARPETTEVQLTTTDPTGGPDAWVARPVALPPYSALSCLAAGPCLATAAGLASAPGTASNPDPVAGGSWTPLLDVGGSAVSCGAASLCAVASDGDVLTSTTPFAGPYADARVDGAACWVARTSCVEQRLQVLDTTGGSRVVDRSDVGRPGAIGPLRFLAGGPTLTWSNDGVAHRLALR